MAEHASAARRDLSSVRKVEFNGALAKLVPLERDEWGAHGSYGTTETFTLATAWPARAAPALRHGSHGPPLHGSEVRIVAPEGGPELANGEPGEIALRGPTLMLGYWKTPRAECFDAEGFYRTGDAGWLDAEGHLHWRGRLTGLIKTGGANVSPLEVEEKLAAYPGVQSAHALGVPHPTLGEALVLCVVTSEGSAASALDVAALREFLLPKLAAYKQPRLVLALDARDVALTGSQKIATAQLRERVLQRLAEAGAEIAGHRYCARSAPLAHGIDRAHAAVDAQARARNK
jgi:acyl-CoA synthetase (AMP-forming)/AMP-acid ligase II